MCRDAFGESCGATESTPQEYRILNQAAGSYYPGQEFIPDNNVSGKGQYVKPTMNRSAVLSVALAGALVASTGFAQTPPTPEQPLSSRKILPVWPGEPPGTQSTALKESTMPVPNTDFHLIRNVTVPTLTVFLPKSGNPSKSAVIIAPGGGFRVLAIDQEGYPVAEWFAQHGIAAFVLKYRLTPTPQSDEEILPGGVMPAPGGPPNAPAGAAALPPPMMIPLPPEAQANAIADGLQAIKLVRSNAAKWGIAPGHVVFIGFSAGSALTVGTMLAENPAERPDYVGVIYGGPIGGPVPAIPANTPPAFRAVAEDDPIAGIAEIKFFDALREAKAAPELHVYRSGHHGFAMMRRNGTSDHWIDELYWWMASYGLTKP
jgi:acetyl esterase/lipase